LLIFALKIKILTQAAVIRYILEEGWTFSGQTITLGGFAGSPYRARETSEAFRTLNKAMLLELVYPTTNIGKCFRLINLPFYLISKLPEILEGTI
jgi:hypothetical protein